MNGTESFLLKRAQQASERSEPTEIELLRSFYRAWQDLHALKHPHAKVNRPQAEAYAQLLVDAALAVNAFYHPVKLDG